MGFIFLPFFIFCIVLSFCYHFLLLSGEGGVVFFIFKLYFGTFFTFLRAEGDTSFFKTCLEGKE